MIKNIFINLTRFKNSTFLNVIGLSCAFAVFMIISMQIRYDYTYDKQYKDYEKIYQLVRTDTIEGKHYSSWNRPSVSQMKNELPEIEYISGFCWWFGAIIVNENREELDTGANLILCDEDFPKIFSFDFIEGDESALKDLSNVIVSDDFAKKHYGNESPIGKTIKSYGKLYKIAAVYKAFPENSTVPRALFANLGDYEIDSHHSWNYEIFVKLHKSIGPLEGFDNKVMSQRGIASVETYLNPINIADVKYDLRGDNPYIVGIMMVLVISILVLASINFVNFAISMVPLKIKGINLRKVVGVSNCRLRFVVVVEALFLTLLSFIIALFFVELFKDSTLNSLISDTSWINNRIIYLLTFIVSVLVGVFASIYPAIYSTSFSPALVLKSSFALSVRGRHFRKCLIGFQFLIAIVFISIALFIQLQYNYLLTRDGRYNRESVLRISHGYSYNKHDALKSELLTYPNIKDVTFTSHIFGILGGNSMGGITYSKGKLSITPVCRVAYNFLDFFEIDVLEGRDFTLSDEQSGSGYWIMSKLLMDTYEVNINEKLKLRGKTTDIIGVCENVNVNHMKKEIEPFAFYMVGKSVLPTCYVRFSGNPEKVIKNIRASYKVTDPNSEMDIKFMDDDFKIMAYAEENRQKKIMQSLSLIAIVIALLGVYGLVSFDTRFRRKEISLRKINGASVFDVFSMFSVAYLKIVLISFVISIPIVFVVVRDWLSAFPYKIPIYWWVFLLAFLFVALLTLAISLVQTYTTARENPINQLKEN